MDKEYTCIYCGRKFIMSEAAGTYEMEFPGLNYDDDYGEENPVCYDCAIAETAEYMSAGLDMDYSLMTGDDPANRPDDWEMHDSDDYL